MPVQHSSLDNLKIPEHFPITFAWQFVIFHMWSMQFVQTLDVVKVNVTVFCQHQEEEHSSYDIQITMCRKGTTSVKKSLNRVEWMKHWTLKPVFLQIMCALPHIFVILSIVNIKSNWKTELECCGDTCYLLICRLLINANITVSSQDPELFFFFQFCFACENCCKFTCRWLRW